MNFTYDLTQPPDGQWGAIQPDGSWSGLVGMLMRGEIDIGNRISWFSSMTYLSLLWELARRMTVLTSILQSNLRFPSCPPQPPWSRLEYPSSPSSSLSSSSLSWPCSSRNLTTVMPNTNSMATQDNDLNILSVTLSRCDKCMYDTF